MKVRGSYLVVACFLSVACGGGGGGTSPPPPSGNTPPPAGGISVANNFFSPAAKSVTVGTTVQWAWNTCSGGGPGYGEETCVAHSVTFNDGVTSPTQDKGTFSRTFNAAGTYDYQCLTHGTAMTGRVTVTTP